MAEIETREGYLPFRDYRTWYRITGNLASDRLPLVVAHGGPGCTHDYVDSFKGIAALDGRAVIHYDQLGNGNSTRLPDKGPDFWTVSLFLEELDCLLAHLGIQERYAFLGQSWGGTLGAEHAVRKPEGLKALVIANSPANMHTWVAEANRLRDELPEEVQATLPCSMSDVRVKVIGIHSTLSTPNRLTCVPKYAFSQYYWLMTLQSSVFTTFLA